MHDPSSLVVTSAACFLLLACGGGGGGGEKPPGGGFTLTGKIGGLASARSGGAASRAAALSAGDVKTVLGFSTGYGWWSSPVAADGSFSMQVDPSTPVGLVFANASDQLVGYLALANGLASLPLNTLADGTTTLDLGTLLLDANVFTPGTDPSAFSGLSSADLTALKNAGGLFAETIKNPDADGDGKIDLLGGMYYRPFVMYFVNPGSFTGEAAMVTESPLELNSYRFCFGVSGGSSYPDTVTFTGPVGSGLESPLHNDGVPNRDGDSAAYGSPAIFGISYPPEGDYHATMGSTELTFHVPDQEQAIAQIALAVPTVTLNADETINRIDWTYQLGGLSGAAQTVAPETLVSDMIVQIEAFNPADATEYRCEASGVNAGEGANRLYDSAGLPASVTRETLMCQDIPWSVVSRIFMAYNDVFGNHVVVGWDRP
jgi:hypothetical protein